ncbi:GIY-YIG nuclease family protein [Microlunatus ginsengisoli]|uniref:GIY-YIG domain-containing protein n=1 Tax=Microlunatus ginsengisoli TaxID=363863 RepID=A0ABP7AV31_9ACTN
MSDPRLVARRLPDGPGVYRFRDPDGRVLYIGRAGNLRRRVQSYWGRLGDRPRLVAMVRRIASVEATWCDSEHEAAWLERNLLQRSRPRWNRIEGGSEVVGLIRLDPSRIAGLRFVHEADGPGRHFGPYLGGLRVRQAISAVHRVLPLPYAVATGGSSREFAVLFGVGPADREALVATAVAVLEREPSAVSATRSKLVRRRDRATAELRFEFAAKIQEEIAALDWITAEQKATTLDRSDEEVCGWADGVLVRYDVRAGRMCTWTRRLASERSARDRVLATPVRWEAFARRNAELAARLLNGEGS